MIGHSQIYKDLTISLPLSYSVAPSFSAQFFFLSPLFETFLVCASHAWAFRPLFLFFDGYFFSPIRSGVCIMLFLSLCLSTSLSPHTLFSAEWYLVMALQPCFVYPTLGCVRVCVYVLQLWRVPCLRSGFRNTPSSSFLSLSVVFKRSHLQFLAQHTHAGTVSLLVVYVMAGERR